jgi:hypothetical protein
MPQVTSFADSLWVSIAAGFSGFMAFLPALIGAVFVLVIGWVISGIVARLIEKVLTTVGLERAVAHTGIQGFLARTGISITASRVLAELAKWFLRLIFIQAAANILRMPQVTMIINSIILFIPKVAVAMLILVVGSLVARFLSRTVRASVSEMGVQNPNLFSNITYYAVIGFSVIAAISQLEIAPAIVNALFIGVVGSVALAFGLAFGLGSRDVAAEITRSWYEQGKRGLDRASSIPRPLRTGPGGIGIRPEKTGSDENPS